MLVRGSLILYLRKDLGFPDGAGGKERTCQCRRCKRCRFDPWIRKIPWRRAWKPTPVFLPGEFHGQRSPESYSPWGGTESDRTGNQAGLEILMCHYHVAPREGALIGSQEGMESCPHPLVGKYGGLKCHVFELEHLIPAHVSHRTLTRSMGIPILLQQTAEPTYVARSALPFIYLLAFSCPRSSLLCVGFL